MFCHADMRLLGAERCLVERQLRYFVWTIHYASGRLKGTRGPCDTLRTIDVTLTGRFQAAPRLRRKFATWCQSWYFNRTYLLLPPALLPHVCPSWINPFVAFRFVADCNELVTSPRPRVFACSDRSVDFATNWRQRFRTIIRSRIPSPYLPGS